MIKIPLKPRIAIEYLLNLLKNAGLTDQDWRDITSTIDIILNAENVDDVTYDNVHQQIAELIRE